jgi:uncharacterized cupredoxin-like copper-binding protein
LHARPSRPATRLVAALTTLGSLLFAAATGLTALAGAPAAGASVVAATKIPTVTIRAQDFSFTMPAKVRAGWTTVKLVNDGGEPHQAQLAKLNPGVTADQVATAGGSGGDAAIIALFTTMGGPNAAAAQGGTASVTVNLTPGKYVAMCFIPSADGVRHYAKGMVQAFTVTKAKGKPAPAPKAKATVTLNDFSFGFPADGLPAKGVVAVKNAGAQDHEIALYQLAAGKTLDDAKAFLLTPPGAPPPAGPPPITEAGGMVGLAPGATGYVNLALTPGTYVAACFFPDPGKGGLPHVIEGMLAQVTVG